MLRNERKKRSDEIRINILENRKSKGRSAYNESRVSVDRMKPEKYLKIEELIE
tara:strand:+ start:399 stop:557 length:159 start_codon:yes stop_codon:yes gene_type:complete